MGNFLEKLRNTDPAFQAEFNDYIQEIKLENNNELVNLHSTISSLRDQLESEKFAKNQDIQKAVSKQPKK